MPALALKVGLLPLGAGDVTPSTDGSSPYSISAPRTPNGAQYSSAVPLIVYSDDAGYILAESVTIPAYSDRIRYSLDGVTYGAWGVGATVPSPITPNGSQVFMQCRGITGDPDVYPFTVSIPPGSVWQAFGAAGSVALDFALAADASVASVNAGAVALDFAVVGDAVVVANAEASVALDFAVSGTGTTLDVVSGEGAVALDFALEGAAIVGSVAAGQIDLDLAVAGAGSVAAGSTTVSGTLYPHADGSLNATANTSGTYTAEYSSDALAVDFRWGSGSWSTIAASGAAKGAKTSSVGTPPSSTSSFSIRVGSTVSTYTLSGATFDSTKSGTLYYYLERYAGVWDDELGDWADHPSTVVWFYGVGFTTTGRLVLA